MMAVARSAWGFPLWVEIANACALTQLTLFFTSLDMVQNFHYAALFPWLHTTNNGTGEERQFVIEIERDGRVGIDLKFGSITFRQEEKGSFAVALVDVMVGRSNESATRVQMEIKVAADPGVDSILGVTEKCRLHIVETLRAAADTFDATTARALLFHKAGV